MWDLPLLLTDDKDGQNTRTLANYRGKLIILDFWATWCLPCIRTFTQIKTLRTEFPDQVEILSVTAEGKRKIENFIANHPELHIKNTIYQGQLLSSYFTFHSIPHIIWISTDGFLMSTTSNDELNKANILSVLYSNGSTVIKQKVDIDLKTPLIAAPIFQGYRNGTLGYSFFKEGKINDLPSTKSYVKNKNGLTIGYQAINKALFDLYEHPVQNIFKENNEQFSSKRIILNTKKKDEIYAVTPDNQNIDENIIIYERFVPSGQTTSLDYQILADLNTYTNFFARIEKVETDCLVLIRTSQVDKIRTKGDRPKNTIGNAYKVGEMINYPLSHVVNRLDTDFSFIPMPVIDETGYKGNVDIKLSNQQDLKKIIADLNLVDLDLIHANRMISKLIISDKYPVH